MQYQIKCVVLRNVLKNLRVPILNFLIVVFRLFCTNKRLWQIWATEVLDRSTLQCQNSPRRSRELPNRAVRVGPRLTWGTARRECPYARKRQRRLNLAYFASHSVSVSMEHWSTRTTALLLTRPFVSFFIAKSTTDPAVLFHTLPSSPSPADAAKTVTVAWVRDM